MFRTVGRLSPIAALSIFSRGNDYDVNTLAKGPDKAAETGWERVKAMYKSDEYGQVSLELHHVSQATLSASFIGACYGGFINSRLAYLYFIENNQATAFKTTMEAKRKLQDFVTIGFARGAYKWGWRLGTFTGLFSIVSTTISVYRGNTSLVEYISAGALTGALYKANLGLAASFVGAGLGAILSAVGGLAILGLLKLTGFSMEDIRASLYKIKEAREEQMRQAMEKASEIKNDNLTRHHDSLVEETGEVKIDKL